MKLNLCFTPYTKTNSKVVKDLNMRLETIKLLEENLGEKLHNMGVGSDFLDMTPKTWATKAKISKWSFVKLKEFLIMEENN